MPVVVGAGSCVGVSCGLGVGFHYPSWGGVLGLWWIGVGVGVGGVGLTCSVLGGRVSGLNAILILLVTLGRKVSSLVRVPVSVGWLLVFVFVIISRRFRCLLG